MFELLAFVQTAECDVTVTKTKPANMRPKLQRLEFSFSKVQESSIKVPFKLKEAE